MNSSTTTILVTEETNDLLMKVSKVIGAKNGPFRTKDRKDIIDFALTKFKTELLKAIDHKDETALKFNKAVDAPTGKGRNSVVFHRLPFAAVTKSEPSCSLTILGEDLERLNFIVEKLQFNDADLITNRGIRFNFTSRQQIIESVLLGALCALLEPDDVFSYPLPAYVMFNPRFNNVKVDPFTIEVVHLPIVLSQDQVNLILDWRGKADFMVNAFLFKGPMKSDSVKINYASNQTLNLNVCRMDCVSPLVKGR